MNYLYYDPEDIHDCDHCQHLTFQMSVGLWCSLRNEKAQNVHMVNDCELWKSPFLSDYRRRHDLERQQKKGTQK